MSANSRLKAIYIIGQGNVFYRWRLPEFWWVRKETIDIYILVTFGNGCRKSMQPIRITSKPHSRIRKWSQLRGLITVRVESGIISVDSNIADNIVKKVINVL